VTKGSKYNGVMTVRAVDRPGWLGRIFGAKKQTQERQFVGGVSVWYFYPEFRRCGTWMETILCAFWTKWDWERSAR
jgi:hypothetical protein